jgi:large subunit ribosomal protein L25
MAKGLLLKAQKRDKSGTKQASKLREQGKIPAIVYGHKKTPVAIALDKHEFVEGLHHGHRLMEIQIDGQKETILVKEVQYDHLSRDVVHADLMRVSATQTVTVEVPIEVKGTAKGAAEGGVITVHVSAVEVECRVTEIPESFVISVREMNIDDAIHVKDIVLPAGVKLVSDPEMLVVSCSVVAEIKTTEEVEAEAPAAPEVITEKKVEEEAAEAAEGAAKPEKKAEKEKKPEKEKKAE